MKIVAGLGNPGAKYQSTRHNVGFRVIDHLCQEAGVSLRAKGAWHAQAAVWRAFGEPVLLVKPQTFMNASGKALAAIVQEQEIRPQDALLIVDDVALDFGELRIRSRGSAGGHNGLLSVAHELGTQDFPRLRVGIGPRPEGGRREDLSGFVLAEFSAAEEKKLDKIIAHAAEAVQVLLREGVLKAMNRFNAKA